VSTALISLAATADTAAVKRQASRPQAAFLTQLIATRQQAPQTRTRRRAEPDEAIAAYAGTDDRPLPAGRALSRSL
jgi:hypothetical protein